MAIQDRFAALRKEVEGTASALDDLKASQEAVAAAPMPDWTWEKAAPNAPPSGEKGAPGSYTGGSTTILGTFGQDNPSIYNAGSTTVGGTFGYGGAIRPPDTTPGRGGIKKPANPASVEMVSFDGRLKTTLAVLDNMRRAGLAFVNRAFTFIPPATNAPVTLAVWDATIGFQDAGAIFPIKAGAAPKVGGGGGGAGGGGGISEAGGGGAAPAPGPPPGSSISGKAFTVAVAPPSRPSPGELLIHDAVERQTETLRQLVRSQRDDMGLGLRRIIR